MSDKISTADMVYNYTAKKLTYISSLEDSPLKAMLANLRHGIGKTPAELPQVWGIVFEQMPEELMGKYGTPSYSEWAVYIALTLYSLHQQGNDVERDNMNVKGMSLGNACARLCTDENSEKRIIGRLGKLIASSDIIGLENNLRSLVKLLKNEGIGLDYALLAKDIFLYQSVNYVDSIRLKWGRDFYRELNLKNSKKENK